MAKKITALRDLGDDELLSRLAEAKETMFNLRFQLATGQQENTARLGDTKKEIARLNTLIRQREIALAEAPARAAQSGITENANG
jgi:large subunit ribosomal protein L29